MPITLITGLPGNGKTLLGLKYTKDRADKENRQVYYSGVKDLNLPWIEIEAEEWHTVPHGSIVFIDECQRVFRPRMHGKAVPKHVEELETHRHNGIDLVLVTQHPMLADTAIRRLTDKHLHVVRTFGTEAATVHEWGSVRENCEKPAGRQDSIKHITKYPKEVYGWYKSAELHTVKRNIPMKFWLLCFLPVVFAGLVYLLYKSVKQRMAPDAVVTSPDKPKSAAISHTGFAPHNEKGSYKNALEDAKQYMHDRTPRLVGLAHTAPIYDDLTRPTVVAMPAVCVHSATRCQCYSQQGTKMDVTQNICVNIAHNGYFQEFDHSGKHLDKPARQSATDRRVAATETTAPLKGGSTVSLPDGGFGIAARVDGVRAPQ